MFDQAQGVDAVIFPAVPTIHDIEDVSGHLFYTVTARKSN